MPEAADGGNAGNGTPNAGQPNSGASGGTKGESDPTGESGNKILGRFNSEQELVEGYQKLESSYNTDKNKLRAAEDLIQGLSGLADYVERDPVSGKVQLKTEIREKLSGNSGDEGGDKVLRAKLLEQFNKGIGGGDPAGAFIDTIMSAINTVGKTQGDQIREEMRGDISQVRGQGELQTFIGKNPQFEPLVEHVGAWLQSLPQAARAGMNLEDAFEVVKGKLKRNGRLDETGYTESTGSGGRRGPSLSGGSAGASLDPGETDDDAKKIKSDILGVRDPLREFIRAPFKMGKVQPARR